MTFLLVWFNLLAAAFNLYCALHYRTKGNQPLEWFHVALAMFNLTAALRVAAV